MATGVIPSHTYDRLDSAYSCIILSHTGENALFSPQLKIYKPFAIRNAYIYALHPLSKSYNLKYFAKALRDEYHCLKWFIMHFQMF